MFKTIARAVQFLDAFQNALRVFLCVRKHTPARVWSDVRLAWREARNVVAEAARMAGIEDVDNAPF